MLKNTRLDYDGFKQWFEQAYSEDFPIPYQEFCMVNENSIVEDDSGLLLVACQFRGDSHYWAAHTPLEFLVIEESR